jgi:hypothetical protein
MNHVEGWLSGTRNVTFTVSFVRSLTAIERPIAHARRTAGKP